MQISASSTKGSAGGEAVERRISAIRKEPEMEPAPSQEANKSQEPKAGEKPIRRFSA